MNRVQTAPNPRYNLDDLNTHPPTRISTNCNPSPNDTEAVFGGIDMPQQITIHKGNSFGKKKEEVKVPKVSLEDQDDYDIQMEALKRLEH